MSRQLKPLNRRRGYHRLSRSQVRRIAVLEDEVFDLNAFSLAYVERGKDISMVAQDALTDIRPKFIKLNAELRGLGRKPRISLELAAVFFDPPTF